MELDLFSLRLKHRFPESNTLNYAFKYIVQREAFVVQRSTKGSIFSAGKC